MITSIMPLPESVVPPSELGSPLAGRERIAIADCAGYPIVSQDNIGSMQPFFGDEMEPEAEEEEASPSDFDPASYDPEDFDELAGRYATGALLIVDYFRCIVKTPIMF